MRTERDRLDHAADDWLIAKAVSGNVDAYEVLVRRHRNRIYRIALRMLANPDDAEDVAQDVVIQLWTALAGFAGEGTFTTWLYRIVVNRCLNLTRQRPSHRPITSADGLVRIAARVIVVTARQSAQQVPGVRVALSRHLADAARPPPVATPPVATPPVATPPTRTSASRPP